MLIVDSGSVYDATITGGRLGVFEFDQPGTVWAGLTARCLERMNKALQLDGTDDYVKLAGLTDLGIQQRCVKFLEYLGLQVVKIYCFLF